MPYLIAYDIAHPRRLARVARRLEHHAQRVQKSVFLATLTLDETQAVLDELVPLIEPDSDRVQAWKLAGRQPRGLARGQLIDLQPPGVVITPGTSKLISGDKP